MLFWGRGSLLANPDVFNGSEVTVEIAVSSAQWRVGHEGTLTVSVWNHSAVDMQIVGTPALFLTHEASAAEDVNRGRNRFWAPINPVKGEALPIGGRVTVRLPAGQKLACPPVEVNALRWGKEIGAVWPALLLQEAVPSGPSRVALELEIEGQGEGRKLKSNEVRVEVQH
jgi:hypothetical protein